MLRPILRKSPLLDPKLAGMADQFIGDLEKTTARIAVQAPAGAIVSIDGAEVDASAPLDVAPGAHTVTASALGKMTTQKINAPVGQTTGVTLTIDANGTTEPPKMETHSVAFPPPTGAIILGVVGIVGLGLGVGFGLASQSKNSQISDLQCTTTLNSQCGDLNSSRATDATISLISYIAGGALLAGGVAWWIIAPRKETVSVGFTPSFGPNGGALHLHGSF